MIIWEDVRIVLLNFDIFSVFRVSLFPALAFKENTRPKRNKNEYSKRMMLTMKALTSTRYMLSFYIFYIICTFFILKYVLFYFCWILFCFKGIRFSFFLCIHKNIFYNLIFNFCFCFFKHNIFCS